MLKLLKIIHCKDLAAELSLSRKLLFPFEAEKKPEHRVIVKRTEIFL